MRISTRGRYALMAMVIMAQHDTKDSVKLRDIAEKTEISDKYLEQLFIQLRSQGLVKGLPGANGGYVLGRPAEDINSGDVLKAVESSFSPVVCLEEESCNRIEKCTARKMWKGLQDVIYRTVDNISLKQLAEKYLKMKKDNTNLDFSI